MTRTVQDPLAATWTTPTTSEPTRRRPRWLPPVIILVVFGAGLAVPRVVTDRYLLGLLVAGLVLGLAALAVGFLADQLGLYTFGIGAFYGSGAYGFALATGLWQWQPLVALLFAIGASAVIATAVGALIARLPVIAFLMVTLALTQMCAELVQLQALRPYLGGDNGVIVSFEGTLFGLAQGDLGPAGIWPLVWCAVALAVLALHQARRGWFGARLRGIRENEERMRFSGFGTYAPRVVAFVLASSVAALGGVLHALSKGFVTPEIVGFGFAGTSLIATLVGGTATLLGPLAGAVLYTTAQSMLSTSGHLPLFMGLAIAGVVIFLPGGVGGLVRACLAAAWRRIFKGERDARH